MIGRGGAVISKLQEDSQSNLKFQPESEMEPNALGRRLEITGAPMAENQALYLVCRKVGRTGRLEHLIPSSCASAPLLGP